MNERKTVAAIAPVRQHAYTGPVGPVVSEPSHAERVRTLVALTPVGTLATVSKKHPGFPFGSLMPFAMDELGRAIFLISNMAMHTQNLKGDARCSLFVGQVAADGDALGAARVTLVGKAEPVVESEREAVKAIYLARHESSRNWVDFSDFGFFRLEVVDLYYVGGFGVMGWVTAEEYGAARPDLLMKAAPTIIEHMNAGHEESMILLSRVHAGIEATEATMTSIDRLGFSVKLKTAEGMKGTRINYPRELTDARETRGVLVEMVKAAEDR